MNWSTDYSELPKAAKKPGPQKLSAKRLPKRDIGNAHLDVLLIRARRQELTPAEFCRHSGLPYATCWRILQGELMRPTLDQIAYLAAAVNMDVQIKLVPR